MDVNEWKWADRPREILQQVRDVIWGMKSSEDIGHIVTAVQEGLKRLGIPFTRFGVNVVEENADSLMVHFYTIPPGEKVKVETESIDETSKAMLIVDWWRCGEVVHRKDLSSGDPYGEYAWCSAWDILCVLDVPFSHGTLAVSSDQPDAFSAEDIQTLEEMARVLSGGFQRQEDLLNLERHNRELETEIEERRRAEETLRKSEGILNVTGKIGRIGGWEHDLETGKAIWTQALYDIVEIPYDREPPGIDEHLSYYPPRDRKILAKAYKQAIDSGIPFDLELQAYTSKKKRIWCRLQGESTWEGGKCVAVHGILQDITERKQAEEIAEVNLALQRVRNEILLMEEEDDWGKVVQRLERELRNLIDFEDCGINVLDEKNDVQIDYYMKLEELQREKVMGIPSVLQRVQEENKPLYRKNRAEIDQWENNRSRPEIHSVIDVPFPGGTLAINSKEENAFGEGDIQTFSQFAQVVAEGTRRLDDITKRKRMEQELVRLERLRAVGELSAGVSHNLNNILTNVLGPAQLLQRKIGDPELLREVDDIITSAVRARDLVHELHLSVRTEEEETLKVVSVDPVMQRAVQTARPRWKDEPEARGVTIEMVTQWGGTPPIQGTEAGLHDIFTNLIFNAVDAMPEGGGITIQTQMAGDQVRIIFSDTGTGMDEATRLRIFEPFFTTKMDIGTGLGLSTVYNTVTRWEGAIEVDSSPGEGTMFTLHFPIGPDEAIEKKDGETAVRLIRAGKVLIVDDDEAICRLLSRLLEERHEVEAVDDGRQALDSFVPGKYDAVMIDLGMSGMPGDQLVKRIRKIDPIVATVLITGWVLPEADERVGSFDFRIEKPFGDLDEVEDVVARAIELHDERDRKKG
jgi:signal transduction histidine kinase/PAS domain-containing protein